VDIKELKEKFNLPISNGDGKSIESPIIIEHNSVGNYVKLEYFIITKLLQINDNFDYKRSNQKLLNYHERTIDYLKVEIKNKRSSLIKYEEFYFDITKVYNESL